MLFFNIFSCTRTACQLSGRVEDNLAGNRQELENKSAPVLEAVLCQKGIPRLA